jgi:hypothetical protein
MGNFSKFFSKTLVIFSKSVYTISNNNKKESKMTIAEFLEMQKVKNGERKEMYGIHKMPQGKKARGCIQPKPKESEDVTFIPQSQKEYYEIQTRIARLKQKIQEREQPRI